LLLALGDLVVGWLLLRQADVALAALTAGASPRDQDFYTGKVAAAKFFAQTRLPLLSAERVVIDGTNLEIMAIPESAF
jgi:Acetyl-CoA dehydrogenase C-terminal like